MTASLADHELALKVLSLPTKGNVDVQPLTLPSRLPSSFRSEQRSRLCTVDALFQVPGRKRAYYDL